MSRFATQAPRILFHVNPTADYLPRFRQRLVSGISAIHGTGESGAAKQLHAGLSPTDVPPEFLHSADVLVLSPFIGGDEVKKVATLLPEMKELKWIHSLTAGVDAFSKLIDDNLPKGNGDVPLTNARGAFSSSLAEYAVEAMLHFSKDVPRLQRNKASKAWDRFTMEELRGKKAGFIGFGSIAQATARLCAAFDMEVIANRRNLGASAEGAIETHFGTGIAGCRVAYPVKYASKVDVFRECDFVVCTLPFTADTENYCDEECFASAKEGQVFISLGRGQAVNEAALIKHSKKFKGIAMDVFAKEPLAQDSPLWELPNTLISAHNADITPTYENDTVNVFLDRYREFVADDFSGFRPEVRVSRSQGY